MFNKCVTGAFLLFCLEASVFTQMGRGWSYDSTETDR